MDPKNHEIVYVVDFGAQYAQLIARRVREQNCYCEIVPHTVSAERLRKGRGIILTGGPASVYADDAPHCDPAIFDLGVSDGITVQTVRSTLQNDEFRF